MSDDEYMVGPIPEHDKGAHEALTHYPTMLMRGMFKGDEVTFVCLAKDMEGRILAEPPEEGDACFFPFAVLHGLNKEDVEHCLDSMGCEPTEGPCGEERR